MRRRERYQPGGTDSQSRGSLHELVITDLGDQYSLTVWGPLGFVGGEAMVFDLDSETPEAERAAQWLQTTSGIPRRQVLAELRREQVRRLIREEMAT